MRVLWIAIHDDDPSKNVVSMDFDEARKHFLKSNYYELAVYFEDIQTKGNFNLRFQIWKKIGKFGVDDGVMIHDCRNKRKKDKLVCETQKEFPEDEFFLKKYLILDPIELK